MSTLGAYHEYTGRRSVHWGFHTNSIAFPVTFPHIYHWVSSDLENLEYLENLEMSGSFDVKRKSQRKVRKFFKNKKSQGILLCEIHFRPI